MSLKCIPAAFILLLGSLVLGAVCDAGVEDSVKSKEITYRLAGGWQHSNYTREQSFSLQTHTLGLELTGVQFWIDSKREFTVTVKIESTETTVTTVTHTDDRPTFGNYKIAVSTEQTPVVLSANTKYDITLSTDAKFLVWTNAIAVETLKHFTLQFPSYSDEYSSVVVYIYYKTLTPR